MDLDSLRDVDCACGRLKQCVLALDGGGMRGYASLVFLERLMRRCAEFERHYDATELGTGDGPGDMVSLPCHYFDYIAGTSTGGLIAMMLGRLRMTVADAKKAYEDLGGSIFGRKRRFGLAWSKYDADALERAVKKIVQTHCNDLQRRQDNNDRLEDPQGNTPCCRTICYVMRQHDNEDVIYVFRSYSHASRGSIGNEASEMAGNRNTGGPSKHEIWQVGRAVTAAPHYFKPKVIESMTYWDAGVEVNNPSYEAYREVRAMHELEHTQNCRHDHAEDTHRACKDSCGGISSFVSIGTGLHAPETMFSKGNIIRKFMSLFNKMKSRMTDTEKVHGQITDFTGLNYFRFNVDHGLESFKMDACKTIESSDGKHMNQTVHEIEKRTTEFIDQNPHISNAIRDCAKQLVKMRRARWDGTHGSQRFFEEYSTPGPLQRAFRQKRRRRQTALMSPQEGSSQANGVPYIRQPHARYPIQQSWRQTKSHSGGDAAEIGMSPQEVHMAANGSPPSQKSSIRFADRISRQQHQSEDIAELSMSPTTQGPVAFELPEAGLVELDNEDATDRRV